MTDIWHKTFLCCFVKMCDPHFFLFRPKHPRLLSSTLLCSDARENKRIRAMVEKMMCLNLKFHHIAGTTNAIADCLSRLTRKIREAEHFPLSDPILADYAAVKKIA